MNQDLRHIEPRAYVPAWQKGGVSAHYATFYGGFLTVQSVLETLQVGKLHLARLLGCPTPRDVFRWFSQDRRPGPMYLERMIKLLVMEKAGTPLVLLWAIDWDKGILIWRKGFEPDTEQQTQFQGADRDRLPNRSPQPAGRATTYLDREADLSRDQANPSRQLPKSAKYFHMATPATPEEDGATDGPM